MEWNSKCQISTLNDLQEKNEENPIEKKQCTKKTYVLPPTKQECEKKKHLLRAPVPP